ncbi:hypothetical protein [Kitasatospora sp. NPDC059673]|uniref:hypothetical protein n=1 Tax=Kitasatospora sp. NPDC059673 TaxID=3346901 RepID=UPI0036848FEC
MALDAASAASSGKPLRLVGGKGKAALSKEAFERPGEGAHRPAGAAGTVQQGLGVVGLFVHQQPAQSADHAAGVTRAVPFGEMAGEVTQPGHRLGEPRSQILGGDEGSVGVLLPAGRTESEPGMAPHLAAADALPRWLLGLPLARAVAAPSGAGLQEAGPPAARTDLLRGLPVRFSSADPAVAGDR